MNKICKNRLCVCHKFYFGRMPQILKKEKKSYNEINERNQAELVVYIKHIVNFS
jgi:hypothetical protein